MLRTAKLVLTVVMIALFSLEGSANTVPFRLFRRASSQDRITTRNEIERRALLYFVEQAHPQTGLVRDKANNFQSTPISNNIASIAATGFGLAVIANAATRGLIDYEYARHYAIKTVQFARNHVPRRQGWFLHWVNWETGEREWNSEYSPIDTALFMAGALYAVQIFKDPVLTRVTNQLYEQMDFNAYLTNNGRFPRKRTMSLSYSPEEGFSFYQWNIYAEQKIMLLLGLGHPTRPMPIEAWTAWLRHTGPVLGCNTHMGFNMPLFVHQYSEVFFDFRRMNDGFGNYHENGATASRCHRNVSINRPRSRTERQGFWGLSAGEAKGAYKVFNPLDRESTICIGCTIGSMMYMPQTILEDATQWRLGSYRDRIWGRYGFVDSIDIDQNWYSDRVLGITVGPEYMSIANMNASTSIWSEFMRIPAMQRALQRANATRHR